MLPVNNGFVADASGKIAMSCGTLASSLSKVRVVALFAGSVIVVVSNASPDAVTVVVVPPGAGAPDDGGGAADVGGGPPRGGGGPPVGGAGPPLAGGPLGGAPPPPPLPGVTVTVPVISVWMSHRKKYVPDFSAGIV